MHGAGKWVDGWSVRGCRSQENAQDGEIDPTDRVLRVRGIGGSNVKQQPHELERQLRAERERERESKQQCAGSNNNKKKPSGHQSIRRVCRRDPTGNQGQNSQTCPFEACQWPCRAANASNLAQLGERLFNALTVALKKDSNKGRAPPRDCQGRGI